MDRIWSVSCQKDFQSISGSSNDTTAFRISDSRNHKYHIPNYKELIHEMDLCLGAASKVYDLTTMDAMLGLLSAFGDIAVMTTNQLNANCKLNKYGYYWYSDIEKELAKTPLAEDLSIMLKSIIVGLNAFHVRKDSCLFPKR